MVRVVDEDVVALRGPEHGALRGLPISSKHREELFAADTSLPVYEALQP